MKKKKELEGSYILYWLNTIIDRTDRIDIRLDQIQSDINCLTRTINSLLEMHRTFQRIRKKKKRLK